MGLIWLVLAGIAVWALVRLGRQSEKGPGRGQWRVAATLLSAVLLAGGALALFRGVWITGGVLIVAGLYLALGSRLRTVVARGDRMSEAEARSLLGIGADASPEAINVAWRRLMARAHPDQGGTEGLAARLNEARDRLIKS